MGKQTQWSNDYAKRTYDRISLFVDKGRKEEIKAIAEAQGDSLNGFINKAIDERMERLKNAAPD